MSEFFLTLPSNTHGNSLNKTNHFRVELPHTIDLEGNWDVALVEILYPYSWDNVQNVGDWENPHPRAAVLLITPPSGPQYKIALSRGYYESPQQLNYAISGAWEEQKQIEEKPKKQSTDTLKAPINLVHIPGFPEPIVTGGRKRRRVNFPPFYFKFNDITKRNHLKFTRGQKDLIWFEMNKHLQYLTGFDRDLFAPQDPFEKAEGKYAPDLRGGVDAIYVYCDIVENQIIGNTLEPLLRIVPVVGKHGDLVEKIFNTPHYVPVLSKKFSSIEIHIKTDTDSYVPFNYGKVIVKLHFRKRPNRFFE